MKRIKRFKKTTDLYLSILLLYLIIYLFGLPILNHFIKLPLISFRVFYFGGIFVLVVSLFFMHSLKILSLLNFIIVLFAFNFMYFFSIWDYQVSTMVKGTVEKPYLLDSDPELYHNLGMFLAHKKKLNKVINNKKDKIAIGKRTINSVGYPVVLGYLYRFIPDLSIGIFFNMFSSILIIILIGGIAYQIVPDNKFVTFNLLLASISPQILSSGVILLKDSLIIYAIASVILFFVNNKKTIPLFINLMIGILIISSFRAPFLLILFFISLIGFRFKLKNFIYITIFLFIVITFLNNIELMSSFKFDTNYILEKISNTGTREEWNISDSNGFVVTLVGSYNSKPLFMKLIQLPLPAIIQYLLPFDVWNFNIDYPFRIIERNMNIIWLLFVGPLIIFGYFFLLGKANILLRKISLIGLFAYLLIAFLNSGAIPRYYYPFMPLLIPIGAFSLYASLKYIKVRNHLKIFMFTYYVFSLAFIFIYFFKKLI